MSLSNLVNHIVHELQAYKPVVKECSTGSFYITFSDSKVKQLRVANHGGHKLKPYHWELRTDVMSKRSGTVRVYNSRSISQLLNDFK